jgi:hypothetical protein
MTKFFSFSRRFDRLWVALASSRETTACVLLHSLVSNLLFFMHLEAAILFSDDQHIPALPVGYPYGADAGLRQFLYVGLRFQPGEY